MKVEAYADREMMMLALADTLAGEINQTLMRADRASFAVPGGITPGPIFDALSAARIDWSRVDVLLTDERLVPAEAERSNERLLRERLLVDRAGAANFVRLVPEGPDADLSDLRERIGAYLPLSVLLLGMGTELNVASLYPHAPEIGAALGRGAPPLMVVRPPDEPEPRITLTGPVLRSALAAHILVTGPEKREALREADGSGETAAPVRAMRGVARIHWAE